MLEIKGVVQHYDWGGRHFIPLATGSESSADLPIAEYWLGDHQAGTALLSDGTKLSAWLQAAPLQRLGSKSIAQFGKRLPFLLKLLDVKSPLSIQVHPTKEQAIEGYKREQQLHLPATQRCYKDDNHKPELMLALSDFWLLHGFRQDEGIRNQLSLEPSLSALLKYYDSHGLKALVEHIFSLPKSQLGELIGPVIEGHRSAYECNQLSKMDPIFWLVRAALLGEAQERSIDPGLIMILLLNLMYVPKGEVVFQNAGVPHAYLEGQTLELMANSDNVVRGGLTGKLINVPELMRITEFEGLNPSLLQPVPLDCNCREYVVPVPDFALREYCLASGEKLTTPEDDGPCLWFILSGELRISGLQNYATAGDAFYQKPGELCVLAAQTDVVLYRTATGHRNF